MTELRAETAVVDRFEGDLAVLLLDQGRGQIDVPRAALPPGVREGTWLSVTWRDGTIDHIAIDEAATEAARARIADKLARLRRGDHLR